MKKSFVKIGILSLMACACAGVGVANLQMAKAESNNVQCVGAYIKFKTGKEDSGLRFGFTLNDNVFADVTADTLTFANESTTFGIMLYPTDYYAEENVVNVEISANQFRKNDKGAMESYAYIYDLEESMYNAEFTAVGYLTIDGETEYTKAETRSMASVAYTAVNDPNLPENSRKIAETYLLEYNVTLKVDGEEYETEPVRYGNPITTVAPEKAGYVFKCWTYENGNAFDVVTGDCTLVATYVKNIEVANVSLKKSVGTTVALNKDSLGLTFDGVDESTVDYEVVKTVGASTTLGTAIAATESFVVETGCLYDVTVTAQTTKGDTVKAYVQVSDEDVIVLNVKDFKMASPTTYVATTEYVTLENGMEVAKVYNNSGKHLTAGSNTPVIWFDGPNQTLQYQFYATLRHSDAFSSSNWLIARNVNGKEVAIQTKEGRYLIGTSNLVVEANGYHQLVLYTIMSRANPTELYATFENIVLVPVIVSASAQEMTATAGDTISLTPTALGLTIVDGAEVSYKVTEKKGAGTTVTALDVASGSFTVQSGYFYDVEVTATVAGTSQKVLITVYDSTLSMETYVNAFANVSNLSAITPESNYLASEHITINGNGAYKLWWKNASVMTERLVYFHAKHAGATSDGKKYKVYADISVVGATSSAQSYIMAVYSTNGAVVNAQGRVLLGTASWYDLGHYMKIRLNSGLDNINGYLVVDNVVFVEQQ